MSGFARPNESRGANHDQTGAWCRQFRNTAEASLPLPEDFEGGAEIGTAEVRPHALEKDQFRVSRLPQQEVRQALLASRPNHKIDIVCTAIISRKGLS